MIESRRFIESALTLLVSPSLVGQQRGQWHAPVRPWLVEW
jgi:hypothetical protein